jgi:hypothetical protein
VVPVLAALAFLVSCCGSAPPPEWPEVLKADSKSIQIPPSEQTRDELVIYLDGSGSMAGYVSKDGRTVYGKTLRELRNVVVSLTPPVKGIVHKVDVAVGPVLGDMVLERASMDRYFYNGTETNLAGTLAEIAKEVIPPPKPSPEKLKADLEAGAPPPPPRVPPARFHLLITDGVQSSGSESASLNCAAGDDQSCVRDRIFDLLKAGQSCVVLGVRSQFNGNLYSETNRLTGVGSYAMPYQSQGNDARTFRPFYIYLFSNDPESLAQLVSRLKERLSKEPFKGFIHELPIALPYTDGMPQVDIQKQGGEQLLDTAKEDGDPPRYTVQIDLATEKEGPRPLTVKAKIPWSKDAADLAGKQGAKGFVKWTLRKLQVESESQANSGRFPDVTITSQQQDADGSWVVTLAARYQMGVGCPLWAAYSLEAVLDQEGQQVPDWVNDWSTDMDSSPETGNRTLNLESQMLGLWHNEILAKRPLAQTYLRVGPR